MQDGYGTVTIGANVVRNTGYIDCGSYLTAPDTAKFTIDLSQYSAIVFDNLMHAANMAGIIRNDSDNAILSYGSRYNIPSGSTGMRTFKIGANTSTEIQRTYIYNVWVE